MTAGGGAPGAPGARGARSPLPWLGGLLTVYLLGPVLVLVGHLGPQAWHHDYTQGLLSAWRVSAETASIAAVIIALTGVPLGYLLATRHGRVWQWIGIAVQLPLAVPPLMSGILLLYLIGPYTFIGRHLGGRLTDSLVGIVLAQVFVASPFLVIAARSAFGGVDPVLDDLAATLGHSPWSRFLRVSLPLAAPGIQAGLLLAWLRSFGEFGATILVAYHPYSLPVYTYVQFSSIGLPATLAATGAAILTAIVVLTVMRWRPVRRPRTTDSLPAPAAPAWPPGALLRFDLHHRLGDFALDVRHQAGSPYLAVLGASGAGKSVTLRSLAGLLGRGSDRIELGDEDLALTATEARGIGYVPQDAALFPHLRVWQQLTFGVGVQPGVAAFWLERLGLTGLHNRLPTQLSGGQRQRVAFARALAVQPRLLLLDEPFSSLDVPVRAEMQRLLRRLQREAGVPTVLVTHDPSEAALLADDVVVIAGGRVLQAGARSEVFAQPGSAEVARLLGVLNIGTAVVSGPGRLRSQDVTMPAATGSLPPGTPVGWCVRAERLRLGGDGAGGVVLDMVDIGAWTEVVVRLDGGPELTVRTTEGFVPAVGERCRVDIDAGAVSIWAEDRPTGTERSAPGLPAAATGRRS